MELKQIKELMAAMKRGKISKLSLKEGDFSLELNCKVGKGSVEDIETRGLPAQALHQALPFEFRQHHLADYHHAGVLPPSNIEKTLPKNDPSEPVEEGKKPNGKEVDSEYITSPIVGTLYNAPDPDVPPFVKVGDTVDKDTVVCIVEAMKVMNEVKAGVEGVVAEILVEDSQPVEFGSKIFRIESVS